jgi:branched-chain amino acid transport system permease protein
LIVLQAALSGLMIGGLYAVMAMGLSLSWGMLKVINLAHFGFILLGSYLSFQLVTSTGADPLLTVVVTAPAFFLVGAALQWIFDRFRVTEFNSLLISFGFLIALIQLITNIWTADFRRVAAAENPYATGSIALGSLAVPVPRLLAFLAGLAIAGAGQYVLTRTFVGRAVRALAEDRQMAAAFGVDPGRIGVTLAGLAAATGAVSGMLIAIGSAIFPALAFEWFGIVFVIVILGGIGHLLGTLGAGLLVGMLSAVVTVTWSPAMAPFVLFGILILTLLFRPYGLFGRSVR